MPVLPLLLPVLPLLLPILALLLTILPLLLVILPLLLAVVALCAVGCLLRRAGVLRHMTPVRVGGSLRGRRRGRIALARPGQRRRGRGRRTAQRHAGHLRDGRTCEKTAGPGLQQNWEGCGGNNSLSSAATVDHCVVDTVWVSK